MTRLHCEILTLLLLIHSTAYGQIITGWDDARGSMISSITDTTGNEGNIIMDWNSTLGEFGAVLSRSKEKIDSTIKGMETMEKEEDKRHLFLKGMELDLPSFRSPDGVDLYLLTEEGMTIYMAMNPPAFFQDMDKDVMKWILYYGYDKREYTKAVFNRYSHHLPLYRQYFEKVGIPLELSLLTIIESGCRNDARSSAGAVGMWQFMSATANDYGLDTDPFNDERRLAGKSTAAAALYLADAYKATKNWTLAAASYNCGIGKLKQIMKQSRHKDWDTLKNYFPKETRQYIPALIAIYYVWTYQEELGLKQ